MFESDISILSTFCLIIYHIYHTLSQTHTYIVPLFFPIFSYEACDQSPTSLPSMPGENQATSSM